MASVLLLSTATYNMIFKAIFSNSINPVGLIVMSFIYKKASFWLS